MVCILRNSRPMISARKGAAGSWPHFSSSCWFSSTKFRALMMNWLNLSAGTAKISPICASSRFCASAALARARISVTSRTHSIRRWQMLCSSVIGDHDSSKIFTRPSGMVLSISRGSRCSLNSKFMRSSPIQAATVASSWLIRSEPRVELANTTSVRSRPAIWSVSSRVSR